MPIKAIFRCTEEKGDNRFVWITARFAYIGFDRHNWSRFRDAHGKEMILGANLEGRIIEIRSFPIKSVLGELLSMLL
ncbi:hypothetical protein ACSU64_29555 [Bacillaceae bacterium C204]|uniref:hypothetical protein n=1 Tax=Neobacillus sp. 204 TaxID=3383351 RepID=UPI00397A5215